MRARNQSHQARSKSAKPARTKRAGAEKRPAPRKWGQRRDFGAPIEGFFAKQPAALRQILEALRELVEQVAPDAESSIKWGMPFYSVGGTMICALGAHKSHVNLVLSGPPKAFDDPDKRLSGGAKAGRHLKLRSVDELPVKSVRGWLRVAVEHSRKKRA